MTIDDKLRIIHTYGITRDFFTSPSGIGMVLVSKKNNIRVYRDYVGKNAAINELFDKLKNHMNITVGDIDDR